jgi:co-chaperonin GroES (HSP10)
MSIRVLGDRVAIELGQGVGKIGALFIPDATKSTRNQTFTRARVVSVGIKVASICQGDTVVSSEYFGDEVEIDGRKLRIGRERDITAVLAGVDSINAVTDRLMLDELESPDKIGDILLPESARKQEIKCRVISVGPEARWAVKPGDTVLIPKHKSVEVRFEGKRYRLIDLEAVLTIL